LLAAVALDDAEAASLLLHPFRIEHLRGQHMLSFGELAESYGEKWTSELLRVWFGDPQGYRFVQGLSRSQWLTSLPDLCDALPTTRSDGPVTAHQLLEPAWASLAALIGSAVSSRSPTGRRQQLAGLGEPLAALIRAAEATQATDLQERIVAFCRSHGDVVTSCVIRALRVVATASARARSDDVFAQLAEYQAIQLRVRLAQPARAADDWSIELPGGCSCELCSNLRSFLSDPVRRMFEWPLAKDRRSHVHSRIDQAELPLTHLTRRQGRPFTLVLTKTKRLFEHEAQQRTEDQADLDWLLDVCESSVEGRPGSGS
jgi:hypothetical protein